MTSKNQSSKGSTALKEARGQGLEEEKSKNGKARGTEPGGMVGGGSSGQLGQLGKFSQGEACEYLIKGKYRLMSFCKGGAFGDVFFAKHSEKNYDVAIKFVLT
jgi:hypothetical protein